jgi:hypothetical protein
MQIVPLTDEWSREFFGSLPAKTVRGIAVLQDSKLWAVAGVYLSGSRWVMFFELVERPEKFSTQEKRIMLLGYRAILSMIEDMPMPVQALADPDVVASDRFLTHLGFVPVSNRIYQWQW